MWAVRSRAGGQGHVGGTVTGWRPGAYGQYGRTVMGWRCSSRGERLASLLIMSLTLIQYPYYITHPPQPPNP